ncbi:MAG TPA: hypothetical protein VKA77_08640 [Mycobacterium sp.]|nr:hypothetical protein [Mycobacterium sp.]
MVPLDCCGCRDPWLCRCHEPDTPPTEKEVDGYVAAVVLLRAHGLLAAPLLPELRAMWRHGGADHRLAVHIAEQWGLAG